MAVKAWDPRVWGLLCHALHHWRDQEFDHDEWYDDTPIEQR